MNSSIIYRGNYFISSNICNVKLQTRMGQKNGKPILRQSDIQEFVNSSGLTQQDVEQRFQQFNKGKNSFS